MRPHLFAAAAVALVGALAAPARAEVLATDALLAPLAPGQESRLHFSLTQGFNASEPVWLVYELVALAADGSDGSVDLEQSFEGVKTPLAAFYASFKSADMVSREADATLAQRFEQITGQHTREELRERMGAQLHADYEAMLAGKGRVLGGRMVRRLPAPESADAPLLVSVERATGMQPLALKVTVGQGSLPAEFQEKPQDSPFYKAGYAVGLALFGWLLLRFFRRRG